MNRSISTQLSALGLAVFVTVSLMGGIQHLASTPAPADSMAQAALPQGSVAQVVVITGQRMARS